MENVLRSVDGFELDIGGHAGGGSPLLPQRARADSYLAALVESSEDAILSKDLGGIVTTWNKAAEQMFGFTAAEAIGKPVNIIIPTDRAEEEWIILKRVAAGERLSHFETSRIKRDGTLLDVSLSISPIFDTNGTIVGAATICRDISEKKAAECALRESEAFLKTLLDSSPDCVKVLDLDTRLQSINAGGVSLLEIDQISHHLQKSWIESWTGPERQLAEHAVAEAKAGRMGRFQALAPTHKGNLRWWDIIVTPLIDERGKLFGLLAVSRDVTEQRRGAEALQRSVTRLNLLAQSARELLMNPDPLQCCEAAYLNLKEQFGVDFILHLTTPPDGCELSINYIRGLSPGEADRLKSIEIQQTVCAQVARHREAKVLSQSQINSEPRAETVRSMGITAYACFPLTAHEQLIGTLSFGSRQKNQFDADAITVMRTLADMFASALSRRHAEDELIEAQKKLKAHAHELEGVVQQRTASLERSLKSIEELLYTIAHDLRAPNRAMRGFADLLLSDYAPQLDETAREYLHRIAKGASRNDELIGDLLAFGKLSHQEVPLGRMEPRPVIEAAVRNINEQRAGATEITIAGEWPLILGNEPLLKQVAVNLISNSIKYVRDGIPPEINIHGAVIGEWLEVTFADNGVGIPPEHRERVFEPFTRLQTSEKKEGTGMGLAIVRKAVERMHGTIAITSSRPIGAEIRVKLHLAKR